MIRGVRTGLVLAALAVLSACQRDQNEGWLGYAEGDTALIAPPKGGWIANLAVTRGSSVKQGDLLFTLDATREEAARDSAAAQIAAANAQGAQAEAQRAQAKAQEAQASAQVIESQKELARREGLLKLGGASQRELEQAQAAYDSARAARAQAEAQQSAAAAQRRQAQAEAEQAHANLAAADFDVSERSVRARIGGQVQDIYFRQGEYVNAGTPVVAILPPANVYVRFFVPETDVESVKLGARVHIGCDGCPPDLAAAVSFVSTTAEFTPPIIYSVANRRRLVFKVEARAPQGLPLRPGLPVNVTPAPP